MERRRMPFPRLVFSRSRDAGEGAAAARLRAMLLPHLDAAYGYARYLTRDDSAAEDVVQEAFLRGLRAIDQCRGNPKAWLLAIVRNCFLDWARANGRHDLSVVPEGVDPDTPETLFERAAAISDVRRVIECLPEPFRGAIVLRELEELSYREIAEVTGVPIGTVMSRLARARQMLAAMLADDAPAKEGQVR
jgi:RNA polymerase sigma-70 factor (ECF subfamily)